MSHYNLEVNCGVSLSEFSTLLDELPVTPEGSNADGKTTAKCLNDGSIQLLKDSLKPNDNNNNNNSNNNSKEKNDNSKEDNQFDNTACNSNNDSKNSNSSTNSMRDNKNNNKNSKNNTENKNMIDKNKESHLNDETISKLPIECQELLKYKCEYKIGENGNGITFKPSPHLNNKEQEEKKEKRNMYGRRMGMRMRMRMRRGRRRRGILKNRKSSQTMLVVNDDSDSDSSSSDSDYEEEFSPKFTDIERACFFVSKTMNCNNIEAIFTDHMRGDSYDKIKDVDILKESYQMKHGFLNAAQIAWKEHLGLKIEPIHIWLMILQAVAMHVDYNSELLRNKWVNFDGKKKLVVNRDDFVKGQRELNNWSEVIESFCDQIDKNTAKDCVSLLDGDFSNSTQVDKIATKITIMDICKSYFTYVVRTRCGFKHITLAGTKNDWIKIYEKTEKLLKEKVEPDWGNEWSKALLPVLKRFIIAFDGKIDCLFWNSMIKRGARKGSGGWSWYSGWINIFFPYIKENKNEFCVEYCNTNDYILNGLKTAGQGIDINNYPYGLSCAPVKWEYYSCDFHLKFISGFIGTTVTLTQNNKNDKNNRNKENIKELSAMVGWIIGEEEKQEKHEKQANLDLATLGTITAEQLVKQVSK